MLLVRIELNHLSVKRYRHNVGSLLGTRGGRPILLSLGGWKVTTLRVIKRAPFYLSNNFAKCTANLTKYGIGVY